jgi:hypothetical protein
MIVHFAKDIYGSYYAFMNTSSRWEYTIMLSTYSRAASINMKGTLTAFVSLRLLACCFHEFYTEQSVLS